MLSFLCSRRITSSNGSTTARPSKKSKNLALSLEAACKAHKQDLDTKKRLSRMMGDYPSQKDVYISKCGEELVTKRAKASRKGEEEGTHREEEEHKAEQRRWCEDVLQKKRHGSSNNGRKKPMPLS